MEDWSDYRKRRWQEAYEDAAEAGVSNAAAEEHADEIVADLSIARMLDALRRQ